MAVAGPTMQVWRNVRTLGLWEVLEHFKQALTGPPSRSLEGSLAENSVGSGGLAPAFQSRGQH